MLLFASPEKKADESPEKWCDHDGPNGHKCVAAKCLFATEKWRMYAWSVVATDGRGIKISRKTSSTEVEFLWRLELAEVGSFDEVVDPDYDTKTWLLFMPDRNELIALLQSI